MNYYAQPNPYKTDFDIMEVPAALAEESARVAFLRRTYVHVFGAILLLVGIDTAIFMLVPDATLRASLIMILGNKLGLLAMLGAFMVASFVAQSLANSNSSPALQYAGLLLYVVTEALIFVPLLWYANTFAPQTIPAAGLLTLLIFGGLTAFVLFTKADFSGLGTYLWWGGIAAMGIVIAAIIFQFSTHIWFASLMVGLMSGYIVYDTSNILHRYRTNQHVPAALALFASITTLFYYLLRLLMELNRRD